MIWLGASDDDGAEPGWPTVYEKLTERFKWTPDQINALTLFQVAFYLGGITLEHGRVKLKGAAAADYLQQVRTKR